MIRVELHAHTADDPEDHIPYTAEALVVAAAAAGYGALAITLHDAAFDPTPLAAVAREHGIRLLHGIERTIGGAHVLFINVPAAATLAVRTLEDIAPLKAAHPQGLVIAPHPFYPIGSALGRRRLDAHASLWDAIEVNALHMRALDWNRRAIAWAAAHGRPLVGNGDVHRLTQLGRTWSDVDVELSPALSDAEAAAAICAAIRAGRARVGGAPLSLWRAATIFAQMTLGGVLGRLRRRSERL
ncbi:MAG: PHP-associated domain-containing protein [Vicinamibacteraceae bacterium]